MRTDCGSDHLILDAERCGEDGMAEFGREGKASGKIQTAEFGIQITSQPQAIFTGGFMNCHVVVFRERLLDYSGNAHERTEKRVSSGAAEEQISLQSRAHTENPPP